MPGGVPNTNNIHNVPRLPNSLVSYQGGQSIWTHRTCHNTYTHTGNTRQPEPQLKSFSCSSAILSHISRDVILSHNSRNVTCLTPISSYNSRNPASRPSRYHQSFVDHAHPKQTKLMPLHHCLALLRSRHAKLASRPPSREHVPPSAKCL
ncbi:hypothetical protein DEO72_LG3g1695 [Vigna unguiculata]|uniref:Uncharacterized protein n=1 Tax=Vigna unguiculata TaxID=3917 RepID=A0A4D6LEX2_VIGUN|nr:hypothetical protein DEO72_LG3g1695 [Vigna unguiculata]